MRHTHTLTRSFKSIHPHSFGSGFIPSISTRQRSGYKICPQQSRGGKMRTGEFLCSIVHFGPVRTFPQLGLEKISKQKKKKEHCGRRGQGFEKTLRVCQRKEGCAALNHKSFSRLCQISSTLQALKRNKEALLFAFPFAEGDRKLKGAQINLKGEQSAGWCGAGSGAGAPGALRCGRRPRVTASGGAAQLPPHRAPTPGAGPSRAAGQGGSRDPEARAAPLSGSASRRSRRGWPGHPGAADLVSSALGSGGAHGADQPSEPRAERWPGGVGGTRPPSWTAGRGAAPEERTRAGQRRASAPAGIVCGPRPLPRAARPSPSAAAARAFVHARPAHRRAACGTDDGDADTHRPAAEGRVLLIHFPLALARPGRRGRGRARGNGRSAPGTVRAARCTVRSARGGQGSAGDPSLPTLPRDRRTD